MTQFFRLLPSLCALSALLSTSNGQAVSDDSKATAIVVRVGDAAMTLAEVQQRMDRVSAFQLSTLGDSDAEIREAFLQAVLVPELLLSQEAERRKLPEERHVQQRIQQILVDTMQASLREEAAAQINDQRVSNYFNKNKAQFAHPEKLRLFRLLVGERNKAVELLQEAKGFNDLAKWRKLVREHSMDQATRLRGGDLGFVHPDGNTDVPRVRVGQELFRAAAAVNDGQFVDEPIPEGNQFAIVWRRGSIKAVEPEFEQEAPRIRRLLIEAKVRQRMQDLVEKLSKDQVSYHNQPLLHDLDLAVPPDPRLPASATLSSPSPTSSADPTVEAGETGLR